MAEQLRFEQGARQGSAVDGDEWFIGAGALAMNRPSDQLLPCPAFAGNQHGCVGDGDALHQIQHRLHLCGCAHHLDVVFGLQLLTVPTEFPLLSAKLDQAAHLVQEILKDEWLGDIIHGADSEGGHHGVHRGMRRHQQDKRFRRGLPESGKKVDPVGIRQIHVQEDDTEIAFLVQREGPRSGLGEGALDVLRLKELRELLRGTHAGRGHVRRALARAAFLWLRGRADGRASVHWGHNQKLRAATDLAPHADVGAGAANDCMTYGKTQAHAPGFLRRVKRVVEVLKLGRCHADSCVAHRRLDTAVSRLGGHEQFATVRHRVQGVDHEV